jgi:hypothetical protein
MVRTKRLAAGAMEMALASTPNPKKPRVGSPRPTEGSLSTDTAASKQAARDSIDTAERVQTAHDQYHENCGLLLSQFLFGKKLKTGKSFVVTSLDSTNLKAKLRVIKRFQEPKMALKGPWS